MTEIFLEGFIIVTVFEGEYSEGVPEVMDTVGIKAEGFCDLVVVEVCLFRVDRCTVLFGKDKVNIFAVFVFDV